MGISIYVEDTEDLDFNCTNSNSDEYKPLSLQPLTGLTEADLRRSSSSMGQIRAKYNWEYKEMPKKIKSLQSRVYLFLGNYYNLDILTIIDFDFYAKTTCMLLIHDHKMHLKEHPMGRLCFVYHILV